MENRFLTVSALNKYLAYKFETDLHLKNMQIKGEISNLRLSKNHLYFSLKDDESEVRAIMFASFASTLNFMPADGMKVVVTCDVTIFQRGGTYNLNVRKIEEVGLGEQYIKFLELKDRLEKEGLFKESIKKPLPEHINKVAVITSATGDAINDITSTIEKRFPLTKILLYPSLVQGPDAPKDLIKALQSANKDMLADVIIIGRGGGSFEDLSCFNDEDLAREIRNSVIPVVSAVGHEADYTIADFVSDRRAPTPTGAAVIVTKDINVIAKDINDKIKLLAHYYKKNLEAKYYEYEAIINRHYFKNFLEVLNQKEKDLNNKINILNIHSPLREIENKIKKIDELKIRLKAYNIEKRLDNNLEVINEKTNRLNYFLNLKLENLDSKLLNLISKMEAINPLSLLKKGYVLTYQDKKLITLASDINYNKNIELKYYDDVVSTKPIKKGEK